MNQKLSDWASIAEIGSGIAVVVTLVLLILGIRENTDMTRASMFASSIESLNATERAIMADPDLARVFLALRAKETNNLDADDRNRLIFIIALQVRTFDMAYSMQRYGLYGDNEWSRFERNLCAAYQRAAAAGYDQLVSDLTTPEFMNFVRSSCPD